MANEEHLAILKQGVKVWNEWREKNDDIRPELRWATMSGDIFYGANFSYADLNGGQLSGAGLNGVDFSYADLSEAQFIAAELTGANLSYADLSYADLGRADLSRANLHGADLNYADLSQAYLSYTDLGQAHMGYTWIGNVDLSTVKGLETVIHHGPSTIGVDTINTTIYASQGQIPDVFLRGAGVPDGLITYLHSLTGEALQYDTCLISYTTKDQAFAQRLYADLQAKGVRCWLAPDDGGGRKINDLIDPLFRWYDKLIVVFSEHSRSSERIMNEIYDTRRQEAVENRRKLFPISLVAYDTIRQWKAFDAHMSRVTGKEIPEYFIPDFTKWKDHDAYQKAFDQLLKDLKAEAS